jgi:hypothetical protein
MESVLSLGVPNVPIRLSAALIALFLTIASSSATFAAEPFTPTELGIIAPLKGVDRMYVEYALQNASDGILKLDESADWKSGDVGTLETERVKVRVLSDDELLVTQRKSKRPELTLDPAIRAQYFLGERIIVSRIPTGLYTDYTRDLGLPPDTIFVCLGERSYQEPAGATKKTREIRAVNLALAQPVLDKLLALRGQRSWTIEGRSVRGQARAKASRGSVEITTTEGKTLTVRLSQLSQADQQWLSRGGSL